MSERLCECGCGRDISRKRAGARTYNAACRKRLSRWGQEGERPPTPEERAAIRDILDAWRQVPEEPRQEPLLDPRIAEAFEQRVIELRQLQTVLEQDECVVGRSLRGRVGTPMGGQGGILHWARPLYRK